VSAQTGVPVARPADAALGSTHADQAIAIAHGLHRAAGCRVDDQIAAGAETSPHHGKLQHQSPLAIGSAAPIETSEENRHPPPPCSVIHVRHIALLPGPERKSASLDRPAGRLRPAGMALQGRCTAQQALCQGRTRGKLAGFTSGMPAGASCPAAVGLGASRRRTNRRAGRLAAASRSGNDTEAENKGMGRLQRAGGLEWGGCAAS